MRISDWSSDVCSSDLAIGRSDDFRTVNQEKFCIAFICHGAGEAGLACAGRALEQHPPGRIDTQALEQFRIAVGKLYHFPKLINGFGHPPNITIVYIRPAKIGRASCWEGGCPYE